MYLVNAAPQKVLLGVQDLSGRPLPVVKESIPQHCPIVPLFTRKGNPDLPMLVVGQSADDTYGAESFNYRGPYATHQTVLYNEALAPNANLCFIKRIIAPNAKKARLRLAFEMVRSENPVYQRIDGKFVYDAKGDKILDPSYKVTGHRARWLALPISDDGVGTFGDGQVSVGTLRPHTSQGSDAVNSAVYPIADLEVEIGERGNHVGLSLWSPGSNDADPIDPEIMEELGTFMYRLQLKERTDLKSSPATVLDRDGARYADFAFAEQAYSETIKRSVALKDVYANYTTPAEGGTPRKDAPFKRMAIYDNNIATVLNALNTLENDVTGADVPDALFNFITGEDAAGIPQYSLEILGPLDGGIRLDESTVHYAVGGSDGDMTPENYEQGCRDFFNHFETAPEQYMDDAYWPISIVWDSGFDLATKDVLPRPMGLRKDIMAILATQEASSPLNSSADDSSIGLSLRNRLLLTPESVYYGTSNVRGAVYEGSFYLDNPAWTKPVPLTVDLAKKVSAYMGAANGEYKRGKNFSRAPQSVVELSDRERYNAPFRPLSVRNKDWRNGIGYAETYGRNSVFYPAFPSAYPDKTSVLSNLLVSFAVSEIEKVCQRTWRAMTNATMKNEDFIAESNSFISDAVRNRFDGLYTIEPETYFDAFDEASGYSWKCRVNLYAENSRYVGAFTIPVRRASELNNG